MSKADELLNSLSENDISLQLANPETEPHIVIGEDRIISVPEELRRIAVQFDHDVETVTFDCPRYWDGLDMSELSIYINYMRKNRYVACYKATDIVVDNADPNIMHFNWTVSRNVSEVKGELKFLVCIKKGDSEGYEVNHWNSELNTEMYISEGLEVDPSIFDPYPDIISQWEDEVQRVKDILLAARDSGELDGATFTPSVDDAGNLSWTNDRGRTNPTTVNIKGYSPSILVREIEGGRQLIITDNRQSQTVTIMDGTDGTNGYSPKIVVREVTGGKELVITDYSGSQTVTILNGTDGKDGTNGYSPKVVVRDVEGGKQLVITDYSGSQTVDILNGTNGTNGTDGQDGVSPTVATEAVTGGTKVTITDKSGSKSFTVSNGVNGKDGTNGTNGQDGVSPTVVITDINGGHRVSITDKTGTKTFDVMDGTTEISEAVKDYIGTYMYVGEVEPTSGPVLWFDTTGAE